MGQRAVPVIRITAESGSLDFYRRPGFDVEWEPRFKPGLPLFASIRRGASFTSSTHMATDCGLARHAMSRRQLPGPGVRAGRP